MSGYIFSEELLQKLWSYLGSRPWGEVQEFMAAIQTSVKRMEADKVETVDKPADET